MIENTSVQVQYVGFEAKARTREYRFTVRGALNDVSAFVLTIGNESFSTRGVRFQDAPEICSLRLHHELTICGENAPPEVIRISERDFEDYRSAHAPKTRGSTYQRKDPDGI